MPNIGLGNTSRVRFAEQSGNPAAPASTFSILYLLASGVLRVRNAAATVYEYVTTVHDHSGTTNGPKLTQANSHESPDTDSATTALHHTIGTSANTAAAGNHSHAAPDAAVVTYTPAVAADWDSDTDPGDANDALDQLAERVDDLEGAGYLTAVDAAAVTYTPAVAADWDGDADPGNADDALDQLAERVDDLEGASAVAYVYSQIIFSIEGANLSATGVKPLRVYAPLLGGATATILGVRVAVNTSPGAANLRMDVHKGGSTILNTTAYVEVAVGAYTTERTTDFVAPGTFAAGDYFQIEVVQGDATVADCTVAIEFKYQAPAS